MEEKLFISLFIKALLRENIVSFDKSLKIPSTIKSSKTYFYSDSENIDNLSHSCSILYMSFLHNLIRLSSSECSTPLQRV